MGPYLPKASALGHIEPHVHATHQRQVRTLCYFGTTMAPTSHAAWYQRASKHSTIHGSSTKRMELRQSPVSHGKTGG